MGQRRDMPTMTRVIDHWRENPEPWLMSSWIGWGEPFCFGCGWLPPVADGRADSWKRAHSWLDMAHLHDRAFGGPDTPANLVPLCHLCHDVMPESRSREQSLAWVEQRAACEPAWQMYTDTRFHNARPTRQTTLFRARMRFLESKAAAAEIAAAVDGQGPGLTPDRLTQIAESVGGIERLAQVVGPEHWARITEQSAARGAALAHSG